ncbi:MAG: tetratricopeptide repeat protein [Candidatus Solibacter sp.]
MIRALGAAIALLVCLSVVGAQDARERLLADANAAYRSLRASEAVGLYRQYVAQFPDRADVRVYLGGALLNLNQMQEAFDEAQRAIALDKRYGKGYILAGRVCAARQQWDQAQGFFTKAQNLDPRDLDARYFSGRAWYDANRFERAIEAFEQALKLDAEQGRIYENLGLAQDALGKFVAAEKSLRKAVELARGTYRPYLSYGAFLFRQGRAAEGLPVLRQALAMAPAAVDVRFELARLLYHQENANEAAKILEPALASNECRIHNLMARIHSARGETGKADAEIKALDHCKTGAERQ